MKKAHGNILDTLSKVAEANDEYPRAKMAAALVKGNKIISIGINRMKTDPLQAKFGKNKESIFLHAEIHAIKNALRNYSVEEIRNSNLYIVRVKKISTHDHSFTWGMAKPCAGCQLAIDEFDIKNVVYSTDQNGKYEII